MNFNAEPNLGHLIFWLGTFFMLYADSKGMEIENGLPMDRISCQDRCGEVVQISEKSKNTTFLQIEFETYATTGCSCDALCKVYNDCCFDFWDNCAKEVQKLRDDLEIVVQTVSNHGNISSWEEICSEDINPHKCKMYQFVSVCLSTGEPCLTRENLDPDLFIPVHDTITGLHYVHRKCALCNNARNIMPWQYHVSCISNIRFGQDRNLNAKQLLQKYGCNIIVDGTEGNRGLRSYPAKLNVVQSCKEDSEYYQEFVTKCTDGANNFMSGIVLKEIPRTITSNNYDIYDYDSASGETEPGHYWVVSNFKNIFCALCNKVNETYISQDTLYCQLSSYRDILHETEDYYGYDYDYDYDYELNGKEAIYVDEITPSQVSLTVLFEFHGQNGFAVKGNLCNETGSIRTGDSCISLPTEGDIVIQHILKHFGTELDLEKLVSDATDITKIIANDVGETSIEKDLEGFCSWTWKSSLTGNNENDNFSFTFHCHVTLNEKLTTSDFVTILTDTERKLRTNIMKINVTFNVISISVDFRDKNLILPLEYCRLPTFCESKWRNNNSMGRNITKVLIIKDEIMDGKAMTCYYKMGHVSAKRNIILDMITFCCIIVSILCLMIRICLQLEVSHFKTGPGKMQFFLTVSLLLAFVSWTIGSYLKEDVIPCKICAIIRYFAFLSAFAWMTNIAIDTWRLFRPNAQLLNPDSATTPLLLYHLFGWFMPLGLTTAVAILDYVNIPEQFKPQFGQPFCWIVGKSLLYYFFVPTGLLLLSNFLLFILTSQALRISFKQSAAVAQHDTNNFIVYIKLFLLMGITWSLGFAVAFTESIVIEYIFAILNSLQGFFIFIAFACTNRTRKHMANRYHQTILTRSSPKQKTGTTDVSSSQ